MGGWVSMGRTCKTILGRAEVVALYPPSYIGIKHPPRYPSYANHRRVDGPLDVSHPLHFGYDEFVVS